MRATAARMSVLRAKTAASLSSQYDPTMARSPRGLARFDGCSGPVRPRADRPAASVRKLAVDRQGPSREEQGREPLRKRRVEFAGGLEEEIAPMPRSRSQSDSIKQPSQDREFSRSEGVAPKVASEPAGCDQTKGQPISASMPAILDPLVQRRPELRSRKIGAVLWPSRSRTKLRAGLIIAFETAPGKQDRVRKQQSIEFQD